MTSTLTGKGQATIPKVVRKHLGVGSGDQIKFFIHPDGSVLILPRVSVTALRGIIPGPSKPVTDEDLEMAIERGATASMRRPSEDPNEK